MSINPVQEIASNVEAQVAPKDRPSGLAQSSAAGPELAVPDPGSSPKPESHDPQTAPSSAQMPQDEVQVQRDSGTNGDIVIKYMDHFGNVVLQIPSSQVLGVAHAIDQELAQEAKARAVASETPTGNGGKNHGH